MLHYWVQWTGFMCVQEPPEIECEICLYAFLHFIPRLSEVRLQILTGFCDNIAEKQ